VLKRCELSVRPIAVWAVRNDADKCCRVAPLTCENEAHSLPKASLFQHLDTVNVPDPERRMGVRTEHLRYRMDRND
jgi:hypothetical protein